MKSNSGHLVPSPFGEVGRKAKIFKKYTTLRFYVKEPFQRLQITKSVALTINLQGKFEKE